jgi:hypothetical protein
MVWPLFFNQTPFGHVVVFYVYSGPRLPVSAPLAGILRHVTWL